MDNTENLGSAMAAAAARDRAKSQEQRIQSLESQVQYLMRRIDELRGFKSPADAQYQAIFGLQGQSASQSSKPQAEQQPHGWYGYFGDAGGPLR